MHPILNLHLKSLIKKMHVKNFFRVCFNLKPNFNMLSFKKKIQNSFQIMPQIIKQNIKVLVKLNTARK